MIAAGLLISSATAAIVISKKKAHVQEAAKKKLIYDPNVFSTTSSTTGPLINTGSASDPGACYTACGADSECQQWLFDPTAQTCSIYRGNKMDETFYLKNDPGLHWSVNQFVPSWQFDSDRETCGAMCQSNASCQGFLYGDVPYPSCLMYNSSGPSQDIAGFR